MAKKGATLDGRNSRGESIMRLAKSIAKGGAKKNGGKKK